MEVPSKGFTGAIPRIGIRSEHVVYSLKTDEDALGTNILPKKHVKLIKTEEAIVPVVTQALL